MAFSIPTPSDFKAQFARDFPFAVPSYGAVAIASVSGGAVSAISVSSGGVNYQNAPTVTLGAPDAGGTQATATASVSGGYVSAVSVTNGGAGYSSPPSVTLVSADGDNTDATRVTDSDIAGAILDAQFNINQSLFSTQEMFTRAFCYVAAHYLVEKVRMATQGLKSQYSWITQAKAVGDVSSSYGIPKRVLEDPMLAFLSGTRYGAAYVAIIAPLLIGNVMVTPRCTLP